MSIELTQKEALARLQSNDNLANLLNVKPKSQFGIQYKGLGQSGRDGKSIAHLTPPEEAKVFIGSLSKIDSAAEINREFGIDNKKIRDLGRGMTTRLSFDESLKEKVEDAAENVKSSITTNALDRIKKAIDSITDGKLESARPLQLAMTAEKLATVIEKMGPAKTGDAFVTFNIYAPPKNKEDRYRAIEVETPTSR